MKKIKRLKKGSLEEMKLGYIILYTGGPFTVKEN